MSDNKLRWTQPMLSHAADGGRPSNGLSPANSSSPTLQNGSYFAVAPDGGKLPIPKELFIAISDFMKTRKCPGSITIQFRCGDIVCVEAVAKRTFRNTPSA
jgi:hypothetical protein